MVADTFFATGNNQGMWDPGYKKPNPAMSECRKRMDGMRKRRISAMSLKRV